MVKKELNMLNLLVATLATVTPFEIKTVVDPSNPVEICIYDEYTDTPRICQSYQYFKKGTDVGGLPIARAILKGLGFELDENSVIEIKIKTDESCTTTTMRLSKNESHKRINRAAEASN